MSALQLKTYQAQALASLARLLRAALNTGSLAAAWAIEMQRQTPVPAAGERVITVPYRAEPFGDTPCVCLRIPTGGGKTLLAAHAIPLMARLWAQVDFPLALWLVPSTTIRDQTLKALRQPGHPYRQALEAAYGQALTVLDLDAAPTIAPQDMGRKALVLVATMQSFRVRQTQGRNVYAFSEDFDAHFAHLRASIGPAAFAALDKVSADDLADPGQTFLSTSDLGRVKHSLANLLALMRPLVVVDEAHNAKTDTTFETLRRFAPSAILELTATPVPRKTNVLHSVSARELQAEDMIKLPVMLAEHKAWPDAVRDAVLRRRHLEAEAAHEANYLRPIVLFQAQDKTGPVTPEALRQHLLTEKLATEVEIVIATGDQRGLDGLDLFDPACPVRHVITVEALKEGWDCSFAYVLCSLQNVRSGKDVEQLLGRVLRMPYAARRKSPALNRAYAHVVAPSFSQAATALVDRMVQGMGFEALGTAAMVLPDAGTPDMFGDVGPLPSTPPTLTLELPPEAIAALQGEPGLQVLPREPGAGAAVSVSDEMSDAQLARVLAVLPASEHAAVSAQVRQHNERVVAARSPAQRGVPFAALPRLCLGPVGGTQAELHLFERNTLEEVIAFDLLCADPRPALPGWRLVEQSDLFEIYVNDARVQLRQAQETAQLSLNAVPIDATETDLVLWLSTALRRPALTDDSLRRWVAALVARLRHEQGLSLTGLLRARHALAQAATHRLDNLEAQARKQGFEQLMLDITGTPQASAWSVGLSPDWQFRYTAGHYPARNVYAGRWIFRKHYFDVIHALKSQGEEFECAKALDGMPQVLHWVRNIEQQEQFSFWLPTATDYFYPDFVAELTDGRLFIVEYKGDAYATNDDSREKRAVGEAWARASEGKAVFAMIERLVDGLDLQSQLQRALGA
ncbi:DEAD/DEAH box helicase family protein [Aquabacterium sp.]|uniref:DEAD/DEAH box helicase family protein n=1 Tax=Aquabacterium sp. TaxID=1872578 RepID=UPI002BCAB5DD|nr:DEAD/DEAH box helicase family protein [Aquabacterium sp.]HSW05461.1 DEAD/DEAH box helicase family protein [Aquabacterium sp.]